MAKKKKTITHLACTTCKERNYTQLVGGQRSVGSLELKKYCSRCRVHAVHKETK